MAIIVPFEAGKHGHPASPPNNYPGGYIVDAHLPLSEIVFGPAYDTLAEFVGQRDAYSCPRRVELTAYPESPHRLRSVAETKQHLSVPCKERQTVAAGTTGYPVCARKVRAAGLNIEDIPAALLADKEKGQLLQCPFSALGGVVLGGNIQRVEVTVDATNLHDPPPFAARQG